MPSLLILFVLAFLRNGVAKAASSDHFACGHSWIDAESRCKTGGGTHCPNGVDSDCPSGQFCYADLSCNFSDTPTTIILEAPTPVPEPTSQRVAGSDSRLVAFLGNWQRCPTDAMVAPYTDIVISFAVTYQGLGSDSTNCFIGSPVMICNGQNRQDLVDHWRSLGKNVIVSFGGALMGGSWMADPNGHWDACLGKEEHVVQQLHDIVEAQSFDGVDLDWEYFYDTPARQNFLKRVTKGLKVGMGSAPGLPKGQNIVSHAPMEPHIRPGQAYFDILQDSAQYIDFIMVQYYNGFVKPGRDGISVEITSWYSGEPDTYSAISHYTTIVDRVFNGDATSVVFGWCIGDCNAGFNVPDGSDAAKAMVDLKATHPCNGGAFFWVQAHDNGWSDSVSAVTSSTAGCSSGLTPTPLRNPQEEEEEEEEEAMPPSSCQPIVRYNKGGSMKEKVCASAKFIKKAEKLCHRNLWDVSGRVWDVCCTECQYYKEWYGQK